MTKPPRHELDRYLSKRWHLVPVHNDDVLIGYQVWAMRALVGYAFWAWAEPDMLTREWRREWRRFLAEARFHQAEHMHGSGTA